MAASERVRSRVPAPQRSILPSVPGIPVGAAILIAVACTFLGFLIDASGGSAELTGTFAALYVLGCVAAVAAVRYRGLFSTMVLPPLLLFIAVPLAYQQLTGRGSTSLKDILLNLAIPLVNRFPTMMLATIAVLLIGGARIYLHRREEEAARPPSSRRGESWGKRSQAKKSGPARSSGGLADSARRKARRPKKQPDEPTLDDADEPAPRPARRPAAQVADAAPRVAPSRPREGRGPARGAGRPAAATPRPEGEPPRGARRRDMPPHPQPNVRYRERDSSRTERRRPENL
ncbi:hypothetical protein IU479_03515 [Nocardia abscessus]|uniref:DUF6542 domain-containing protein n=1 Tax=Nocardia TaxID=1817 RepID=UPI0018936B4A|nr:MULTISPECIES: DUF6542 domain-containing protein [Nocardia]MBF6217175.1 hypothetical protein [Nocardia abscessus]MDE1670720.1 hypothetical protein [Nocardia gipuzkoensis]